MSYYRMLSVGRQHPKKLSYHLYLASLPVSMDLYSLFGNTTPLIYFPSLAPPVLVRPGASLRTRFGPPPRFRRLLRRFRTQGLRLGISLETLRFESPGPRLVYSTSRVYTFLAVYTNGAGGIRPSFVRVPADSVRAASAFPAPPAPLSYSRLAPWH
jgi:hypothetical protein